MPRHRSSTSTSTRSSSLRTPGSVAVVNHFGLVRIFGSPSSWEPGPTPTEPTLAEQRRLHFVEDVERLVALGSRLVTSQPRGRRLDGVLVTEPLVSADDRIAADVSQESFGFVTSLTAPATTDGTGWVAMGGEGRVRMVEARDGRLGATRWESSVDFLVATLIESGSSLWAAGERGRWSGPRRLPLGSTERWGARTARSGHGGRAQVRPIRGGSRVGERRRPPHPGRRRSLRRRSARRAPRTCAGCRCHDPPHRGEVTTTARDRPRRGRGPTTRGRIQSWGL